MSSAVVLLSGGLDSTTLMYKVKAEGHDIYALSMDYGQKHIKELDAAQKLARLALVKEHRIVALDSVAVGLLSGSALTSSAPVPKGHYEDESMKATVVPNRNMLLLALGTAYAISVGAELVAYAAHAGDHAIYPDCRPEFTTAMGKAISLCDWKPPTLYVPFIHKKKSDIAKVAAELSVPVELTWSCYEGEEKHCGACGTCIERKEAFSLAGLNDPTDYAQS